jgi:HPt (histidine-containing phosphotransfer) domain-containing protein
MIDHSYLDTLTQLLGKNAINDIRLGYVDDSTQKMSDLLAAWQTRDYIKIQEISHSLKSASLNMAMTHFAEKCQIIEQLAPKHDEQGIHNTIDNLSAVHQKSLIELAAYFTD